jgi:hypothetical protein
VPLQNPSTASTQQAPAPPNDEHDEAVKINYRFSPPTPAQPIESDCRVIAISRELFEGPLQSCREDFAAHLLEEFGYRVNPKKLVFFQASRISVVWISDVLILCSPRKVPRLVTPWRI